jgi:DNA-binding transcriptional regulator YiaG
MTPEQLRAIGEQLYGNWGWQTRMAEALRVDGSTVRRWLSGKVAIPGPALVALELLLKEDNRNNEN